LFYKNRTYNQGTWPLSEERTTLSLSIRLSDCLIYLISLISLLVLYDGWIGLARQDVRRVLYAGLDVASDNRKQEQEQEQEQAQESRGGEIDR